MFVFSTSLLWDMVSFHSSRMYVVTCFFSHPVFIYFIYASYAVELLQPTATQVTVYQDT
jgi:hypothetical protein